MKKLTFRQRAKLERGRRIAAAALSLTIVASGAGAAIGAGAVDADAVDNVAQECAEASMQESTVSIATNARSSIPASAKEIDLIINGRHVLDGKVFYMNGSTYVPMFAFADWLGYFNSTYKTSTKLARITGENLDISATVGKRYISANGRYFYTENEVVLYNGVVYVPILPMVKALNGYVHFDSSRGAFVVSSGDTRRLKSAEQV